MCNKRPTELKWDLNMEPHQMHKNKHPEGRVQMHPAVDVAKQVFFFKQLKS